MTDVSQRLKAERKRLKMTQDQMAKACGVTRESWCKYETRSTAPSSDVLVLAAQAGIDVAYVITGARSPQTHPSPVDAGERFDSLVVDMVRHQLGLLMLSGPDLDAATDAVVDIMKNGAGNAYNRYAVWCGAYPNGANGLWLTCKGRKA